MYITFFDCYICSRLCCKIGPHTLPKSCGLPAYIVRNNSENSENTIVCSVNNRCFTQGPIFYWNVSHIMMNSNLKKVHFNSEQSLVHVKADVRQTQWYCQRNIGLTYGSLDIVEA